MVANVSLEDKTQHTIYNWITSDLLKALEDDDVDIVKSFFEDSQYDINQKFGYREQSFLKALTYTIKEKVLNYLLENGANANNVDLLDFAYRSEEDKISTESLIKLLKNGLSIPRNVEYFNEIKNFNEQLLADYINSNLIDVNEAVKLEYNDRPKSLLDMSLEFLGNEANSYHSKTVEALLAKGAKAEEVIATNSNTKTIIKHLPELINSGFNIKNNFAILASIISDEMLANLLEKEFIQPEFKYIGKRYASWSNEEIEISLFDLVCQRNLSQALEVMADKGLKLSQGFAILDLYYRVDFYKSNLLTLVKMGLNTSEIARLIKSNGGLKEEVLVDLINNNILDVNFIVDSTYRLESLLYISLEKGMQNLTKLLLDKGAEASSITFPGYASEGSIIAQSILVNLDILTKNGFKLLDNLERLFSYEGLNIEHAISLIDQGIIKPIDFIDCMRKAQQIKAVMKSKEFLNYLFEKGLNLDDEVSNTSNFSMSTKTKVSEVIASVFSTEALIPLFKNGLLKVSENLIISCLFSSDTRIGLVITLLQEGILEQDFKLWGSPLLKVCSTAHEVRDYLINHGAFEKLDQEQRDELVSLTIMNAGSNSDKALATLKLLSEQHGYKLSTANLCTTLVSSSEKLVQFAIDNGLDVNKALTVNLENWFYPTIGMLPIQLAAISSTWNVVEFLLKNGASLFTQTKEGYPLTTLKNLLGQVDSFTPLYIYQQGVKPHELDLLMLFGEHNWPNIKHFFGNIDFNQSFTLPNQLDYPNFYNNNPKLIGVKTLSFTHYYATKSLDILKKLIANGVDINATDSSGKTPIFYAANKEIAEFLLASGAKTDVIDNAGNTLLHSTSDIEQLKVFSELGIDQNANNNNDQKWYSNKSIKQLVENDLLPNWKEIPEVVNSALQKGNVIEAAFLQNKGGSVSYDLRHDIVESIKAGILASQEVNKFQALIGVLTKNGIQLPSFLHKYLNDPKDYENTNELKMVLNDQFLNPLVEKYLEGFEVNEVNRCLTDYSKYADSMSQVVQRIEEDLALEVLAINELTLVPLQEEHFVYRGLRLIDIESFTNHNFLHGHKALLKTGVHNFGFHAQEPWSKTIKSGFASWEFSGNYVSFSKSMATAFAGGNTGISSLPNSGGVLMQIKVGPETKFVCGRNMQEFELVTLSTIPVEAIKSLTIVGTGQVISNPNYKESALDSAKPLTEEEMIANYKAMGCEQYVSSNAEKMKNDGELSSYEKFIETFTSAEFAEHRKKVYLAAEPEICFVE